MGIEATPRLDDWDDPVGRSVVIDPPPASEVTDVEDLEFFDFDFELDFEDA